VRLTVASGAERYQVQLGIVSAVTAELLVMNFKIGRRTAKLATPAIAAQHVLTQSLVGDRIESQGRRFWTNPSRWALRSDHKRWVQMMAYCSDNSEVQFCTSVRC
jgi:hypothetical protein